MYQSGQTGGITTGFWHWGHFTFLPTKVSLARMFVPQLGHVNLTNTGSVTSPPSSVPRVMDSWRSDGRLGASGGFGPDRASAFSSVVDSPASFTRFAKYSSSLSS